MMPSAISSRQFLDPITAKEVRGWFNAAIKSGKKPTVDDCAHLADRLNDLLASLAHFPPISASKPRKGKLKSAYDNFVATLKNEALGYEQWERLTYSLEDRPPRTYSDVLHDILAKISTFDFHLIMDPTGDGSPSTLNTITEDIAGRILGIWNSVNNRSTLTIGRETPCEAVLVAAINRVTGKEHEATALQSELRRSDKKILKILAVQKIPPIKNPNKG